MPEINIAGSDFITREVFETYIQSINSRLERLATCEKLEHTPQGTNSGVRKVLNALDSLDKSMMSLKEDLRHEQNKSMSKLGIAIALFVGAVQVAVAVILNFWK